uniref:Uncharacterized protein n=1 Tax=Pristionchus pacificus TaxID=54126 RepID=A0A2A6CK04_PRIPA
MCQIKEVDDLERVLEELNRMKISIAKLKKIYNTSWRFHFPKSLTSGRSLSSSKAGATSTASLTSLAAHSSA